MEPNYIKFNSSVGNPYVYDNNSGQIFCIANQTQDDVISKNRKQFGKYPVASGKPVTKEEICKFLYTNGFKQLQLEVTTGCNLRCKYCCFSDCYELTRSHGNEMMEWETAKAAVDYYFKNFSEIKKRNPEREPYVSFYGGEPLLNFKLIRQAVNYISENYGEYETHYNITTNATLLDDEVADFFVQNDFAVLVSLDGDEETQNRNRCFPNGTGTFQYVMKNLSNFRERYPDYEKISISACYDVDEDFEKVEKFFNDNNLFVTKYSFIDQINTSFFDKYTPEDWEEFQKRFLAFKNRYIFSNEKFESDEFIMSSVGVGFMEFSFHLMFGDRRNDVTPFSGTCVPGEKLYVSVCGDIHMCEKINPRYHYGNVLKGGIDVEKMERIVNEYNAMLKPHCDTCNASKLCNLCFKAFGGETGFEYNQGLCDNFRKHIQGLLVDYVDVLERRPNEVEKITGNYFDNLIATLGRGC